MDETAVQIIKAEIRRHRSLSTMADDMRLEELVGPQYCQCRPECDAELEELNGIDNDKCAQCLEQWLGREARPAEEPGGEPNG